MSYPPQGFPVPGDNELFGLLPAGLAAARPAAGIAGRMYFSTDTLVLERDTGAGWVEVARGETAIRLAQLVEKAHASLTGVTSDQHHAQAHTLGSHSTKAHAELTGVGASDHHVKYTDAEARAAAVSDTAYAASWNGVTTIAPSKNAVYDKIQTLTGVPSGAILIWTGTIANIPSGYVICDGNNSTPNLLTKFLQGVATAATNPGATGGEATHTLTVNEMPSHGHNMRTNSQQSADSHQAANPSGSAQTCGLGGMDCNTQPVGGGAAHQNEPTYYDVAFIMKT